MTSNSLRLLLDAGSDSNSNVLAADPAGLDEQPMGEGMLMVSAVLPWKEPGFLLFLITNCDHLCSTSCFVVPLVWLAILFPFWCLEFLAPVNGPLKNHQVFMTLASTL